MGADEAIRAGLPEPGAPVFYPKVGHCIFRGVIQDPVAPDTQLVELEDIEEGSRILVPLSRVPELNLRSAGTAMESIQKELSSEFEEPLTDEEDRHRLIEELITDGSPEKLARALKRLHFLRQTTGLSREEEQSRKKIRSWLAAEVALSKECTRAEAQAYMTRVLQDAMSEHRRREKEEAKERRRAAKEQRRAEAALAEELEEKTVVEDAVADPVEDAGEADSAGPLESGTGDEEPSKPWGTTEDSAEGPSSS